MLRAGLKFLIKDALRGARFSMRKSSLGAQSDDFPGRSELTRIADSVLTSLEETVGTLRYGSDQAEDMIRVGLDGFIGLREAMAAHDFDSRFASASYRLTKGILALRRQDALYLSELAGATAARSLVNKARSGTERWSIARFSAETALALLKSQTIRIPPVGVSGADIFTTEPERAAALTLGLVVCARLTKGDGLNPVDCVTSASDIVISRYQRFSAAINDAQPGEALAALFAEMATFVP